jgi:hypothetical protein
MNTTKETGPVYGVELIDSLPLGGMTQQMPSRDDLEGVKDYRQGQRVVAGYEVLLAHYKSILKDCPSVHLRKCHDCINIAYHADSVTPHVLCKKCGSQDTRKVKEASTP